MTHELRAGLVILRFYGPLLQHLARRAIAQVSQALKAFSFTEAQGENI